MEFLTQLVALLEKGGPWTVAALCIGGMVYMYKAKEAYVMQAAKEKQELNDRLVAMTTKQIEVLTISNENQRHLVEALEKLET